MLKIVWIFTDFSGVQAILDDSAPCYIIYRLDGKKAPAEWLLLMYVPEYAKVREKMLYASTRDALKKEMGYANICCEMHASEKDEATWDAYGVDVALCVRKNQKEADSCKQPLKGRYSRKDDIYFNTSCFGSFTCVVHVYADAHLCTSVCVNLLVCLQHSRDQGAASSIRARSLLPRCSEARFCCRIPTRVHTDAHILSLRAYKHTQHTYMHAPRALYLYLGCTCKTSKAKQHRSTWVMAAHAKTSPRDVKISPHCMHESRPSSRIHTTSNGLAYAHHQTAQKKLRAY
jgi:hypothetical protein